VFSVVSTNLSAMTAQALTRWRHPVAPSEALDVPYRAMRPASYRRIHIAIEFARDLPAFFVVAYLLLPTNIDIAK